MSIQLEQDERGYLEQLVRRPMKPTRRQKANALLRLAEGDTPEKAAQHAESRKRRSSRWPPGTPRADWPASVWAASRRLSSAWCGPASGFRNTTCVTGRRWGPLRRSLATTADQTIYVDGVVADETPATSRSGRHDRPTAQKCRSC